MLKTKTWIIIISILLTICVGISVFLYSKKPEDHIVQILQNGKCIKEINLSEVDTPYSFVVEDENGGSNTITVEHGRICISEADCPDKVCVKRGWLSDSIEPIVCLPHKLTIQIAGESDLDTFVQ